MPELLPFLLTAFLIELTPGPNMSYLAVVSLRDGRSAGLRVVAGIALGLALIGVLTAFGLAAAMERLSWLYDVLRFGGIAYLLWLAWEGFRGAGETSPQKASNLAYFRQGLITNLLNPKAVLFYAATLPQFLNAHSPVIPQTLVLILAYVVVATGIHLAIVLLAARSQQVLAARLPMLRLRQALSLSLVAVAVWLAYTTAH